MNKSNKNPILVAVGSTLLTGIASTSVLANSLSEIEVNPFTLTELSTGYMQTAEASKNTSKMTDGACGEGKCGSAMMQGSEEKTAEGKCAGNKPMPYATKTDKKMEGKCGEGKCGAAMSSM